MDHWMYIQLYDFVGQITHFFFCLLMTDTGHTVTWWSLPNTQYSISQNENSCPHIKTRPCSISLRAITVIHLWGVYKCSKQHLYLPLAPQVPLDLLDYMAQVEGQLTQQPTSNEYPIAILELNQNQRIFGSLGIWARPQWTMCCISNP